MAPILQSAAPKEWSLDQRRFGRLYSPDPRDADHPMETALRQMSDVDLKRRRQSPAHGPTLDQGATPRCVMYSAATALGAAPITYKHNPLAIVQTPVTEGILVYPDLYDWAQHHDEWPGTDYDGTSVRAGQEYLKLIGRSSSYVWARSLDEAKDYISRAGSAPIILGIDWLDKMSTPRKAGAHYWIEPDGPVVGGHAICCLWYDKRIGGWKLQNSWGTEWGDKGIVYLADDDFNYLVFQANGEAVSFVEQPMG